MIMSKPYPKTSELLTEDEMKTIVETVPDAEDNYYRWDPKKKKWYFVSTRQWIFTGSIWNKPKPE